MFKALRSSTDCLQHYDQLQIVYCITIKYKMFTALRSITDCLQHYDQLQIVYSIKIRYKIFTALRSVKIPENYKNGTFDVNMNYFIDDRPKPRK